MKQDPLGCLLFFCLKATMSSTFTSKKVVNTQNRNDENENIFIVYAGLFSLHLYFM